MNTLSEFESFSWSEVLKNIENKTFLDLKKNEKPMPKGTSKLILGGVQNGYLGFPRSTYLLIFDVLGDALKTSFLDASPMDQQIKQI